jgi:hypothetical protein
MCLPAHSWEIISVELIRPSEIKLNKSAFREIQQPDSVAY